MMTDDFDFDDFDSAPEMADPPFEGEEMPDNAPVREPAYLDGLNDPQREAVLTTEGPVLVLAGAGTGKTRVLTTRITHMLATGLAFSGQILAVTFTNKAAREMQERVARMIGQPVDGMAIGTFHSIAARMLRRHAELVGLESNFTILDTDDQLRILKQLVKDAGIDDKRFPAKQMAALIDRWKNKALTPAKVPEAESYAYAEGKGKQIYQSYQTYLKGINAADFGDLLLHVIEIFQKHPDVLARYHSQYRYMLVDEYQDTNVAQYLWLRLLAQAQKNICCVGDDDQSIYGWRGAEVGNILKFDQDFPGAKVIRLEQNYRSTHHILGAASGLIAGNSDRLGKTLWTDKKDGDKVSVQGVWDGKDEARTVGEEIEQLQRQQVPLSEVAVLVRAGYQTREFEERMITLNVPYRVVGGPRFYERKEIRDALAYLKLIVTPMFDPAFERIINTPKRGIGPGTLQSIHAHAQKLGVSLFAATKQMVELDAFKGKAKISLKKFVDDYDHWRKMAEYESHTKLAEIILEESGYIEMWQLDKAPDAPGRLENLGELVRAMGDFENLPGFLEHISLVMDNQENTSTEKVSIMTLHAAKGLEFDQVFLPGWEESVFPSQMSMDENGLRGLEEERRLAYVGITRAKKKAHILFAANRQIFGQWQTQLPSRFIDELPEEHVEMQSDSGVYGAGSHRPNSYYSRGYDGGGYAKEGYDNDYGNNDGWSRHDNDYGKERFSPQKYYRDQQEGSGYQSPGWARAKKRGKDLSALERRVRTLEGSPRRVPKAKPKKQVSDFAIGERVFHDKFGYGIVEDVEGNKLHVSFETAGEKKIMDSFVKRADDV